MQTSITYSIIPARSGSKGVPDKNIRLLAGHPLLAWSIAAAKLCPSISRVIVSTDSEEYAKIALHYGAEVPFLRPEELSADTSTDRDFFVHAITWFEKNEGIIPECFVHLRPTTPLRDPQLVEQALRSFQRNTDATSLRSAHEAPESPAKWFRMAQETFFEGFLDNTYLNLPRQACPSAYIPNGYVDIVRSKRIISGDDLYFPRMQAFISPFVHEVDTLQDFKYLEYAVQQGHPLIEFMNKYS